MGELESQAELKPRVVAQLTPEAGPSADLDGEGLGSEYNNYFFG